MAANWWASVVLPVPYSKEQHVHFKEDGATVAPDGATVAPDGATVAPDGARSSSIRHEVQGMATLGPALNAI